MTAPWADYAANDVLSEEDHDEPYNRCPLCTAAIAGVYSVVLMLVGYAIWSAALWLL